VDINDVGMLEFRDSASLAKESCHQLGLVGRVAFKDLQGDAFVETPLKAFIDFAHSSPAKTPSLKEIAVRQGGVRINQGAAPS
jgi:hypothetical protein